MAAVKEFAATWWAVRPQLLESVVMTALITFVVLWAGWPLLTVATIWVGVQLLAMTGYAAYLVVTGRPLPGESDG